MFELSSFPEASKVPAETWSLAVVETASFLSKNDSAFVLLEVLPGVREGLPVEASETEVKAGPSEPEDCDGFEDDDALVGVENFASSDGFAGANGFAGASGFGAGVGHAEGLASAVRFLVARGAARAGGT